MKPVFLRKVLAFFLLFGVFAFSAFPAFAQDESQTEERAFAEFHNETISLHGPTDIQPVKFNLPADQKLIGEVEIQLRLTVFLPTSESLNGFDGTAGVLKLFVNGNSVGEFSLQKSGDVTTILTIPAEKILAHQTNEPLNLQLSLESYLPSQNDIEVRVRSTSTIRYSYETVLPNTDLIDFPRQFFQDSFQPDHTLLVIPDQPTITELQSALTVAAGLGRLTNNALSLDLVSVSQVTPEMQAENHLILVGKPEPFLALKGMIFPSPIVVRSDPEWTVQFLLPDRYEFERTAPDDGLVQLINSPWNPSRLILLVSGETDAGVLKAAQAVSSGKLRTNVYPNLAIVKETNIDVNPSASPSDLQPDSAMLSLSNYLKPFAADATLSTTVFVLPRSDIPAWETAIQLAGPLGAETTGAAINLSAYYGDELPDDVLSRFNILAVGHASQFPFIAELGSAMPVLFEKGKDLQADTGLEITYRASKDYDAAGYLEVLPSPENNEYVILTVLGNKQQGLDWAASALLIPSMREQLNGNFVLVNNTQIYVTDKRPDVPSTQSAIPSVTTEEISVTPAASTPSVNPPLNLWQISTIVLVFIVVVLFVLLQRKK